MPKYADNEPPEQKDYKNAVYKALKGEFGKVLPRDELIQIAFAAGVHRFHPERTYHYTIDDRYWPVIRRVNLKVAG